LVRDLYVPRELVFDVWTQPEHLAEWYSPGPDFQRTARVDLRAGGAYRITWQGVDGIQHSQHGVYEVVQAPERLVYSAQTDSVDAPSAVVTVNFTDLGGGTRIELSQDPQAAGARGGTGTPAWSLFLDQLEAYFSVI
jgi:uncharacterized protein YndB with AHSA1/START domain